MTRELGEVWPELTCAELLEELHIPDELADLSDHDDGQHGDDEEDQVWIRGREDEPSGSEAEDGEEVQEMEMVPNPFNLMLEKDPNFEPGNPEKDLAITKPEKPRCESPRLLAHSGGTATLIPTTFWRSTVPAGLTRGSANRMPIFHWLAT